MAQYQHPKDKARVVDVAVNETVKRRILERSGWKLVPQGQEQPAALPASEPKKPKQAQPSTADPQPLNVRPGPAELHGVDAQPKSEPEGTR